ncbi:MAG: hypothetical protein HFE63_04260 [Clostridiales bacterium]|nr:hypothetical protein [Clostridiales bacterium]
MKKSTTKSRFIRIVSAMLAAIMLVVCLGSCGSSSPTAISFGDVKISANMFCYWMSRYKALYLYSYFGMTSDNPQLWTQEIASGVTVGAFLESIAVSNIMSNAICLKLFDDYGLSLSNEQLNTIDQNIQQKIQQVGSKAQLNSALSAFGVNTDILRDIYIAETKISALQDYLYGDNGTERATDEEVEQYYKENYYRCKHILIRTDSKIEYDEDGEPIVDATTGSYKMIELTEEEKAAQVELAKDLEKRVAAGEDFDELVQEYSEDTGMQYFEDGYYVNSASTYLPSNVINAVISMKVGDVKTIESSYGYHITKKYDLIDGAYKVEKYSATMFGDLAATVNAIKMQELIATFSELVVTNDDIISQYPITTCTPNFYY